MGIFTGSKNYRLLFSASAISNLGDGVSVLAYPWLATLISRDPMHIALVAFAARLPWFLLALPAGVITDRFVHRSIMVSADAFRFALTLGVVALIFFGPKENSTTYILLLSFAAFLLGSAEVLRDNTAQTMLPAIVSPDDLQKANGQLWSVEQVMGQFIGPPLAGFLIAVALPLTFLLDAASFAIAAILVFAMSVKPMPTPKRQPALSAMKEGFMWLYNRPILFRMAILLGLMNMAAMMTLTIMVLFAQEVLSLGPAAYGILLTSGAAGGVIGGLIAPKIATKLGNGRGMRLAILLILAEHVFITFAFHSITVGLGLFLGMIGAMLWNVITVSLRQRIIPPELLGRVNSVYRFFAWGMMPIGALLGGGLVTLMEGNLGRETALRMPFGLAAIIVAGLSIQVFQHFTDAALDNAEK